MKCGHDKAFKTTFSHPRIPYPHIHWCQICFMEWLATDFPAADVEVAKKEDQIMEKTQPKYPDVTYLIWKLFPIASMAVCVFVILVSVLLPDQHHG